MKSGHNKSTVIRLFAILLLMHEAKTLTFIGLLLNLYTKAGL